MSKSNKYSGLLPNPGQGDDDAEPQKGKRGRPPGGKRRDPDYEQICIYVRKTTHHAIKVELLLDQDQRDMSELIDDLCAEWAQSRKQARGGQY